ncbi:MAG: CpsD/CapB family tyrosine-protein kinase [Gammaproteobacteria bacterium]|nr:CpsD/CapB family tyrosine-protein kinase [Gammaproteobacteria bacterium]
MPPIVYTRTCSFSPPAGLLERNRIVSPQEDSPAASAYRMLRTQVLQRMDVNGWRSLALFSPRATDGKTTTAVNLALALANDRAHTVVLVELDLRKPGIAERFGLHPKHGIDDALASGVALEDCLYHPQGFDRLVLLPARSPLANSSEWLAGERCAQLVTELRNRYTDRILLFDLPPVLDADDALAFAPRVEAGLVVVAEGRTRRADLVRTIETLHRTPLVGTVLNRSSGTMGL